MKLIELNRPFIVAYENIATPVVFEQMLYRKEHIALVIDEYRRNTWTCYHGRYY